MSDPKNDEDWREYRRLVIDGLERLEKNDDELKKQNRRIEDEITKIKIKMAAWGATFGFIGGAIPLLVDVMLHIVWH